MEKEQELLIDENTQALLEFMNWIKEKPIILMDDVDHMTFRDADNDCCLKIRELEEGKTINIFGELRDYKTGKALGDSATTTINDVLYDDTTWDIVIIEGDDAIYASVGLERRIEPKELVPESKDDFDLER